MKILFITIGFPPAIMSENLCNGKLVLSFLQEGWDVDVITKSSTYSYSAVQWEEPWTDLKAITHIIDYPIGNKLTRTLDFFKGAFLMHNFPIDGIRWAYRAYQKALSLHREKQYDVVITRSPSDISHIVGYKFAKKTGVKWIANWNDPASNIWPFPINYSKSKWRIYERFSKLILTHADINSFPATTLKDHFQKHYSYIDDKKCRIFPHIALEQKYLPVFSKKERTGHTFRICHSGNLGRSRDADFLLEAICALKREQNAFIEFDVIGSYDQRTSDLVNENNLSDSVLFLGSCSYLEVMEKMATYDVLVLIEYQQEFGIFFPSKLVDYAQLGIPTLAISPRRGFVNQQITAKGGGIATDSTNYESVKHGLFQLYDAWTKGVLQTTYSTERLLEDSSCHNVIADYKSVFEELNCFGGTGRLQL